MKTGFFDDSGNFINVPFYKIEDEFKKIIDDKVKENPNLLDVLNEYKNNIKRFSYIIEFGLHELGFMIYDPLAGGYDEILFSNGKKCFIASSGYVLRPHFDRFIIKDDAHGFPVLSDALIKYDNSVNYNNINEGIIDSLGYVDSSFLPDIENLCELLLMHDMLTNESIYKDALINLKKYNSALEYITSKENCIYIKRIRDKFSLSYSSDNNIKIENFINELKEKDLIEKKELIPVNNDLTVIDKTASLKIVDDVKNEIKVVNNE